MAGQKCRLAGAKQRLRGDTGSLDRATGNRGTAFALRRTGPIASTLRRGKSATCSRCDVRDGLSAAIEIPRRPAPNAATCSAPPRRRIGRRRQRRQRQCQPAARQLPCCHDWQQSNKQNYSPATHGSAPASEIGENWGRYGIAAIGHAARRDSREFAWADCAARKRASVSSGVAEPACGSARRPANEKSPRNDLFLGLE